MPWPEIHGNNGREKNFNPIVPNSTISLLHNIPLDNTYEHTFYFENISLQTAYFNNVNRVKYTFYSQSYQRYGNGKLRVQASADDLYDCNYIWFWNDNFVTTESELKYFYAFITSINYINNNVCEVEYELDVIQTYLFDFEFKGTFIEREHIASKEDVPGSNLLPEPVNIGEHVANSMEPFQLVSSELSTEEIADLSETVVVFEICDVEEETARAVYVGGVVTGCVFYVFNREDLYGIGEFLNTYKKKPDAIISAYMCPLCFIPLFNDAEHVRVNPPDIGNPVVIDGSHGTSSTVPWLYSQHFPTPDNLNGYEPRNQKLLTYPYCFLGINNAEGDSLTLRYEYFNNSNTHRIRVLGSMIEPVQVVASPFNYKAAYDSEQPRGNIFFPEQIMLSNWPLCGWAFDYYTVWKAQNSVPLALSVTAGITNTATNMAVGNVAGAEASGVSNIASVISQAYTASISADLAKGSPSVGNVLCTTRNLNFYGICYTIKNSIAAVIDDFFSVYGYAVNRVGIPNRNVRNYWNYVKTRNANIEGSIPTTAMRKICAVHDKGITYWNAPENVPPGSYFLDGAWRTN